ncbi:PREDICTED: zinc finger protein 208-like isoform X1 [Cyprinodon variegatus]|uniref:Zinc finger protein 208-like n=1 Tax=Cyprinodon variegatus TaxID=28743 RepID=A0A3Q2CMQ0_CYPVA|nr:PREDICTED: zinc finger protein 208-like isoform X1 [Cyprinodon variegatus]
MLGLQGNASPSKVYRCVACSETFTGLASLLVHQATHANTDSKSSTHTLTQHNDGLQETQFAKEVSNTEKPSSPTRLPESPASSFYICDCGDEFLDFHLMLEHKRSHIGQLQQPVVDNVAMSGKAGSKDVFPTQQASFAPVIQTGLDLSSPSTSKPSGSELSTSNVLSGEVALEDSVAMETPPHGQCTPPQDVSVKPIEGMCTTEEPLPESEGMDLEDDGDSVPDSEQVENVQKNNNLMKLLASAYQNCLPTPVSEIESENNLVPKQEDIPVDISPVAKSEPSAINDLSIVQLRRLLTKPGVKTKAPPISRILESSRKRVVSLTKTLSPVVVLETRQKLMDPTFKGLYGRYQCGRCRKVFPNLDRLTEHHFLHKKERIKCCRRCKQLIIGRLPFTDNHVCPHLRNNSFRPARAPQNKSPFAPKIVPFHSLNNAKKVYFCPVCKNSYARRWNLKTHRCHGPASGVPRQNYPPFQRMFALRPNLGAKTPKVEEANDGFRSVAVGTEVAAHIKVEGTSVSHMGWTPPAKQFPPFTLKSSMIDSRQDPSLASLDEVDESWKMEELKGENGNEGQWTMPLDDDFPLISSTDKSADDGELRQGGSAEHAEMAPHSLPYFINDGVRRYPCQRCHKTYSKATTLRRHLRLCGFRPAGFGTVAQTQANCATTLNTGNVKPMFSCFVCGRAFNRKDNMMTHRKRCQLKRTMSGVGGGIMLQGMQGNTPINGPIQEEDSAKNWGIMSLPSVLPRRVTCECGVGFTSPRLLLEHLQKHAQESYTCPTCGETVNSWADYEVHLQVHMHPQQGLTKGLQPQRSQPLLLRLQQPQPSQSVLPPQQKLQRPELSQHLHSLSVKKGQRIVCTRCGNSFATRCSLRRHISWNRCKGVRATAPLTNPPKTFHCSHCNSDFPNSISLMFHQRNGACKPAIKPVRCPVCLRWFGTMDSLQKHLLIHKQSDSYRCDVCQGMYRSLKSLKNHRRRIHRILIGQPKSTPLEPLAPECHPSLTD